MKKTSIKPTEDRIVVTPEPAEEKTASGIIIPKNDQEKSHIGTIFAVGPGTKDNPMTLKVGDRVLCSQYGYTEVTLDEQKYLILRSSDVLAKLS
ncbi:MAG: co-chaperone GroES [Bacteroidota bacterium]